MLELHSIHCPCEECTDLFMNLGIHFLRHTSITISIMHADCFFICVWQGSYGQRQARQCSFYILHSSICKVGSRRMRPQTAAHSNIFIFMKVKYTPFPCLKMLFQTPLVFVQACIRDVVDLKHKHVLEYLSAWDRCTFHVSLFRSPCNLQLCYQAVEFSCLIET